MIVLRDGLLSLFLGWGIVLALGGLVALGTFVAAFVQVAWRIAHGSVKWPLDGLGNPLPWWHLFYDENVRMLLLTGLVLGYVIWAVW